MYAIGIDVGGTNCRVGIVSSSGDLIDNFKVSTPQKNHHKDAHNTEPLLVSIQQMVNQAISKHPGIKINGVGIGWPGTVEPQTGTVHETPNIAGFNNFPLQARLSSLLGIPVRVENDAKCAGLAEYRFGIAKSFSNFILMTFGTGIGGAIFVDGHLVRGRSGLAGEIGHLCLYPNGQRCNCGRRGCFEKYCSAKALEERALSIPQAYGRIWSARDILENIETLPWAKNLLNDFVEDLAIALGTLTNLFDPEAIVFSGGLFTTGGGPLLTQLQMKLQADGFKSMTESLSLLPSKLHGTAGIIGAATLMLIDALPAD